MFNLILLIVCIYNDQTVTFWTFTGGQDASVPVNSRVKPKYETEAKLFETNTKTENAANYPRDRDQASTSNTPADWPASFD